MSAKLLTNLIERFWKQHLLLPMYTIKELAAKYIAAQLRNFNSQIYNHSS